MKLDQQRIGELDCTIVQLRCADTTFPILIPFVSGPKEQDHLDLSGNRTSVDPKNEKQTGTRNSEPVDCNTEEPGVHIPEIS